MTVKIQSVNGNVFLSRVKLPIVQKVSTFKPTLHETHTYAVVAVNDLKNTYMCVCVYVCVCARVCMCVYV